MAANEYLDQLHSRITRYFHGSLPAQENSDATPVEDPAARSGGASDSPSGGSAGSGGGGGGPAVATPTPSATPTLTSTATPTTPSASVSPTGGSTLLGGRVITEEQIHHLVRRTTWGPTPDLLDEVRRNPSAWLESQLSPSTIDDSACEGYLVRYPRITASITAVRTGATNPPLPFGWQLVNDEVTKATLTRYAWSRRQLFEVVCDFWSNHLNAMCPSADSWDNHHDWAHKVIRRHAFGSFADMLVASAKHPTMLRHLNNGDSTKDHPNENYAREVMELHTVGLAAGYTETEVRAAARVLTGLTWNRSPTGATAGTYVYDASIHDTQAASVLGWSTPAHAAVDGEAVATSLLRHLANHPLAGEMIARKLCIRFVSDTPPSSLVDRLAIVYTASGTQIVPVLRAMFTSDEFWASQRTKTRRPLEGLLAAVRTLGIIPGVATSDTGADVWGDGGVHELLGQTVQVGHRPLAWAPPNGYPDVAAGWRSAGSTLNRWNETLQLANNRTTGGQASRLVRPSLRLLLTPLPTTFGGLADSLVRRLLGRVATAGERATVLAYVDRTGNAPLASSDPWVNVRLPALVALVLNSAGHMER